jgi:hypothetical protein
MKKARISIFVALVLSAFMLTSYESGPAHHSGLNCTGSETDFANPTGCSNSSSCHGTTATTGIVVTLEVDSANGIPVTTYRGGLTYTVKITGTNTTTNTDAYFGFQLSAITGSTPAVTPVNAGTWQQTNLPTGVQYTPALTHYHLANIIEHNTALSASSGSGAAGTVYTESVTWTAPPAGTGTISFWAALNAVDGLDVATGFLDFWNTTSLVLNEDTSAATGANTVADNFSVNIFPNPATDFAVLELNHALAGQYNVYVCDAEGRKISSSIFEATGNFAEATINTSNWATGIYLLQLTNNGQQKTIRLLKK